MAASIVAVETAEDHSSKPTEEPMVAPAIDINAAEAAAAAPRQPSEELLRRLSAIAARIEEVADHGQDIRERVTHMELRLDELSQRQMSMADVLEQRLDERLTPRVTEAVRQSVGPELASFRAPLEAQAVRLAGVENRLERVESIQVESMNALDVRFGDLAYQTRMALSAGGLVTLAAILVVLLR
jgi:chromosome segregation ATPase